uniref:Uncharacterized protein n=1 Tax=Avena sativa TaxID=4498 RepID=A0ACD5WFH4_AVESA
MVKAYLRYEPGLSFGVVASPESNVVYDPSGRRLLAAALDRFAAWDLKRGLPSATFTPSSSSASLAISCIASSPSAASASASSIASGHADGSIRLWDAETGACEATLHGHRSAASALRFSPSGAVLASGSKDCDVILWDVVAQAGLFRLRGHRDQVTDLVFLDSGKKLVTCSKDKFMRVWDLDTQHCLQIVGGHHSEIWSMDVDPSEKFLVSGSADPELRVFRIRQSSEEGEDWNKWDALKLFGEIPRQTKERVQTIRFNKDGSLLVCQVAGKTADIYRILDEAEATRKAKRRLHRKKEKASAKAVAAEGNGTVIDPLKAQDPTVVVTDVFKLLQVLRTSKKICSVAFSPSNPPKGCLATLSLSLNNNVLETYSVDNEMVSKMYSVEIHGHRSDIRNTLKFWLSLYGHKLPVLCMDISSDGEFIVTGSADKNLKIWGMDFGDCHKSIFAHTDSVMDVKFVPRTHYMFSVGKDRTVKVSQKKRSIINKCYQKKIEALD